jgi:hypothetical protein
MCARLDFTYRSLYASAPMQGRLKWLRGHKRLWLVVFLCAATTGRSILLTRSIPVPALRGSYYGNADWTGTPRVTALDADLSTITLKARQAALGGGPFSVEWRGYLAMHVDGDYLFELVSDDGSQLYVDGESIIDNSGVHSALRATGSISRPAGVYPIVLRYVQAGGDLELIWRWAVGGESFKPVAATALSPRRTSLGSLRAREFLQRSGTPLTFLWVVAAAWILGGATWKWADWIVRERPELARHPLVAVLLLSFGLSVWGIHWGLPESWSPDELTPWEVILGIEQFFSNGWYHAYPPAQFYLYAVVIAPFVAADRLGLFSLTTVGAATTMFALMRVVTVLMGLGLLVVTYLSGSAAFDRRTGVLAALIVAVTLPFVYYAKTANTDVPYLFWMTCSLWLYVRLWRNGRTIDYVLFGATAALAVATKDHAYGFYTLLPVALIARLATSSPREERIVRRLVRASFDRRLWIGGAVAALVFGCAHNIFFNWTGMLSHFDLITRLSAPFAPTLSRTWRFDADLVTSSVQLLRWSLRWPLFLLCAGGLAAALISRQTRSITLWILIPSVSYYFTYLRFMGYVYDRFLLGVIIPLALVGGRLAGLLLARSDRSGWIGRTAVAAAFGYALTSAASLDVMMSVDSRYAAESWLRDHLAAGGRVGWFGHGMYMPRVYDLPAIRLFVQPAGDFDDRPEFLVINKEVLARSDPPSVLLLANLAEHRLGYSESWRWRSPLPWWAVLRYDPVFTNGRDNGETNLDNVNPEIVIFQRDPE